MARHHAKDGKSGYEIPTTEKYQIKAQCYPDWCKKIVEVIFGSELLDNASGGAFPLKDNEVVLGDCFVLLPRKILDRVLANMFTFYVKQYVEVFIFIVICAFEKYLISLELP